MSPSWSDRRERWLRMNMSSSPSSSAKRKVWLTIAILGASVIATTWITGLQSFLAFFPDSWRPTQFPMAANDDNNTPSPLANFAVEKILNDASPIFGHYTNIQSDTSTWMSQHPDSTLLVHMNIPGAHDAATWNYSATTQDQLKPVTGLVSDVVQPPEWFRCQDKSILDMLNAGIRAFDLRYAFDVTNSTLVFWHGPALLSQTASVDAVMFAFYQWLQDHPTETVLLSFQYEGNKAMANVDSPDVQMQLYNVLTSPAAKEYVLQLRDTFGTLGAARGKIILLRRFDLDLLPATYEESIPGIHFSPKEWAVNSASIKLTYNTDPSSAAEDGVAYIEDYYHPIFIAASTLTENIEIKFNATRSNLLLASSDSHPNSLFWTFASGTNVRNSGGVSVTPEKMALGDGSGSGRAGDEDGPENGVNGRLLEMIRGGEFDGKRLGIVMLDFWEAPDGLVQGILGLRMGGKG